MPPSPLSMRNAKLGGRDVLGQSIALASASIELFSVCGRRTEHLSKWICYHDSPGGEQPDVAAGRESPGRPVIALQAGNMNRQTPAPACRLNKCLGKSGSFWIIESKTTSLGFDRNDC